MEVLAKRVRIARRFLRSIRIDTDFGQASELEGFVCPQSSANVLATMARHISENGQGAFTWTGPYGSGKSSLAIALAALLNGNAGLQKQARKLFGAKLSNTLQKSMPPRNKGWRILPVVGRRDDPVAVIGESMKNTGLVSRSPRNGWTETKLIKHLIDAATEKPKTHGGLILFIDEMGKFLESAAQDASDIYIFQQLAEATSRSNGRLLIVGILHQAFEKYTHHLSQEMHNEWAKIQGRFIDLVVDTAGEEQINLISRAIESDSVPKSFNTLTARVAKQATLNRANNGATQLASLLETCWPLHPTVSCLLGPISRRRFGQNQRSIFGFLNSSEPHGFQDFLQTSSGKDLYTPDQLWDYLRANLEPSILASHDGHRWALATEALERCEASGGTLLHIKLLKAIAIIDLFRERSGLIASSKLLESCLPKTPSKEIEEALVQMKNWSLIVFKKFLGAYAIYAGSDFDIEQAVQETLSEIGVVDFAALNSLAGLQPVIAKRHYHATGSFRWFDFKIIPVDELEKFTIDFMPENGKIGYFLLAIPTKGEPDVVAEKICREAARRGDSGSVVVGLSDQSEVIVSLSRELLAFDRVNGSHPELAGDRVARREVSSRLASLQVMLETELHKAVDNAFWFRKHHSPVLLRQADLNGIASDLADDIFSDCPKLHNELLNRQNPSSSASGGQKALLRKMITNEGEKRLGIEGFPAEGGLFASILESTRLYDCRNGQWQFVLPTRVKSDPCCLAPIWRESRRLMEKHADRTVAVSELFDEWRKPPFGVKDGLMPILIVAFMLSHRDRLAVYREGIFRVQFNDVDIDYLVRDASTIQLRWIELNKTSRRLLSDMAKVVQTLDATNELAYLDPLSVARGLIAIFDAVPQWTKRTMRLSANAIQIREIFKRARDPNKLLFDDIPATFGKRKASENGNNLDHVVGIMQDGLEELQQAYPDMLHRLRDIMLSELRVPNISKSSLAELHDRAMNIAQRSGDFRLDAFVGRLAMFDGSAESFESIASLIADKPPHDWTDPDLDRAEIGLAEMSQRFIHTELYARVKDRPKKRHSMAVLLGVNGQSEPMIREFNVADSDQTTIDALAGRVVKALNGKGGAQDDVVLAALAEVSKKYLHRPKPDTKRNKGGAA